MLLSQDLSKIVFMKRSISPRKSFVIDKIVYFANVRIPSEKAHGRQIVEMCNAFSNYCEILLVVPRRYQSNHSLIGQSMDEYFGVSTIDTTVIPGPDELSKNIINNRCLRKFTLVIRTLINCAYLSKLVGPRSVIYTREWWPAILLSCIGKDVVYEAHQFDTADMSIRSITLGRRFLKFTNKDLEIVCISEMLEKAFGSQGFLNTYVAHDSVRLSLYKIGTVTTNKEIQFDVLYTGQLFPEKGVGLLVEAAERLPQISFGVVGGDKSAVNEFRQAVKIREIENIDFIGQVKPTEIAGWQQSSRCLVLPQITDDAQSPMKLFEYMASGVPILASATAPIKEVLRHEENSLLFAPGSVNEFVAGIERMLEEQKLSKLLARRALDEVEDQFTWDARARNILEYLGKG